MRGLSLKRRLVLSFWAIATFSALLCSGVYTYFLIHSFQETLTQRVAEATRTGMTQIDTFLRELQTYSDLISSDTEFGQVLSFDSAEGIINKMKEYETLSKADLVLFVPRAEQYVSIKHRIFSNKSSKSLNADIRSWAAKSGLLKKVPNAEEKGWALWNKEVYVFAAKPVLHFGANMGVIIVAEKVDGSWAEKLAKATGAEFMAFYKEAAVGAQRLFASSLQLSAEQVHTFFEKGLWERSASSEALQLGNHRYISLFRNQSVQMSADVSIGFLVSIEELEQAQLQTLKKVLVMALAVAAFSALIGFLIARAISNPLQSMTSVIQAIGETNDLGKRVAGNYKAEIGILAKSFNQLVERLQVATDKLAASEKRMKDELTMASTVQDMLFPERDYAFARVEISSFIQPSTETGGDWFDYFTTEDQQYTVVFIGDVTGHGMPAALITAIMTGFAQALKRASILPPCHHILESLNRVLIDSTQGKLHMTFFVSVFNHRTGEMRYSSAAHNRPFICQRKPDGAYSVVTIASKPSQRLGENLDVHFEEETVTLSSGDVIAYYTDGLLECANVKLDPYGKRRMINILKTVAPNSAKNIKQGVIDDAFKHFGEHPLVDDVTLVVLKANA